MARAVAPLWLAVPGRFAATRRVAARWLLLMLAVVLAVSLTAVDAPDTPKPPIPVDGSDSSADVILYQRIVEGVRSGGNYYSVAADAQRSGGYPLRPFMTMRLPTLAVLLAMVPGWAAIALVYALAATVLLTWFARLNGVFSSRAPRLIALVLLGCGAMVCLRYDLIDFHEVWAGLLIALSLALWSPTRWVEAVAIGLCAMAIRETAALYAIVMLGCALLSGRRRESAGWLIALIIFAAIVALHARAWGMVVSPGDATGPGWTGLLGPGFFAKTIATETALAALPVVVSAPLVALGLVGWAAWRDPLASRVGLTIAAYGLLIAVFCRADTPYWGLMVAPISLIGLVFVPDGLRDLWRATLDNRRVIVTRRVQ